MERQTKSLIQSSKNPKFQSWKALLYSKGIVESNQAIVSGQKTVPELLAKAIEAEQKENSQKSKQRFQALLVSSQFSETAAHHECIDAAVHLGAKIFEMPQALFGELDAFGTRSPLLVIEFSPLPSIDFESENSKPDFRGLNLWIPFKDPANVGAVIRSALAFQVAKIFCLPECAHPYHPKSLRASVGAVLEAPIWRVSGSYASVLEQLTTARVPVIGMDMGGTSIHTFAWPKDCHLILGEEGRGIGAKISTIQIPMNPKVESLNASVAASLALFSYRSHYPA